MIVFLLRSELGHRNDTKVDVIIHSHGICMLKNLCPKKGLTVAEELADVIICTKVDTVILCDLIGQITNNVDEASVISRNENDHIIRVLLRKHLTRRHRHHKAEGCLRRCAISIKQSGNSIAVIPLCRLCILKELFVYPFVIVNKIVYRLELKIGKHSLVEIHSTDSTVINCGDGTGCEILFVSDRPSFVRGLSPPFTIKIDVLHRGHILQIAKLSRVCRISKTHIKSLIRSITRSNSVPYVIAESYVSAFGK